MNTRDFDPVFSAALRAELEHLPQTTAPYAAPKSTAQAHASDPHHQPFRGRQILITGMAFVIVVAATAGILRLTTPTHASPQVAHSAAPQVTPSFAPLPTHIDPPTSGAKAAATAQGTTNPVSGRLSTPVSSLKVTITCQGNGFPTIHTSDGFTANSTQVGAELPAVGAICGIDEPKTTSFGVSADNGMQHYGRLKYTITPHGPIVWAITFTDAH